MAVSLSIARQKICCKASPRFAASMIQPGPSTPDRSRERSRYLGENINEIKKGGL
jgi:hypothetical protein